VPIYQFDTENGPFATRVMTIDPGRVRTPKEFEGVKRRETVTAGFAHNASGYKYKMYVHDDLPDKEIRYEMNTVNKKKRWKAILRKIDSGHRTQWAHIYDDEFPGCTRGRNGYSAAIRFTAQLATFEKNVMRAAALQARHIGFLKTKYPEKAMENLMTPEQGVLSALEMVKSFYGEDSDGINVDDAVIGHLMPWDEYEESKPTQPISTFEEFESAILRHLSAGADQGYAEFTGDYRRASYSSTRQEDIKAQTSNDSLKANVVDVFADNNATNWMEENISSGRIPIRGLNTSRDRLRFFRRYKPYLANFCWYGTPNKNIDPVKTAVANNIELNKTGGMLLSEHLNKGYNVSFEDWLDEKSEEIRKLKENGLEHLVGDTGSTANSTSGRLSDPNTQNSITSDEMHLATSEI